MTQHRQVYRVRRRYGPWSAGDEVVLTDLDAIQWDNESPGLFERIERPAPTNKLPAPKVMDDADV